MAIATCSIIFFLFCISLSINPASSSKCNKSFYCGDLGRLEFPLSDNTECGLFLVNCTSSPPAIQFGAENPWLEVHAKISTNRFWVKDPHLESLLEQRYCSSFRFVPLPDSPLTSFAIYPIITLLMCSKNLTPEEKHEVQGHYKIYNGCDDFDLYYNYSGDVVFPKNKSSVLGECGIYPMPADLSHQTSRDLFQRLSPTFQLEWNISDDCLSCHDRGGICLLDDMKNVFFCKGGKSGRRRTLVLVSAISATVAFLGLCAVSFLIYRCKKKTHGHFLLSKNLSSGPSFKSDIDLAGRFYFGLSVFSYKELEDATHKFDPSRELGDGGFGTIYYGKLRDGREVAIKRLYKHNGRRVEQFMNEINILTCLRHPNLVSLYGCTSRRSQELLLVYEYIPNGTVSDHLHGEISHTSPLTWPVRMNIAIETATALAYLHSSDIKHRDVKTSNILLDKNFSVKVADFGLSKLFPNDVTHISTAPQGTPGYVDPEYHQCYQLSDKSDVYSFGVVLVELISSMPAVDLTRHRQEINLANFALDRIQRRAFDELIDSSLGYKSDAEIERMTTSVAELAFRCLQLEKDWRPSMDEVLTYLKDIQAREDCNMERTKMGSEKIITSPETEDGTLSTGNIESSPVTVTDTWPSVSSITKSSTTWIC